MNTEERCLIFFSSLSGKMTTELLTGWKKRVETLSIEDNGVIRSSEV